MYGAGAVAIITPTGSELVTVDNGGAVLTTLTTQQIANLASSGVKRVNTAIPTVGAGVLTAAALIGGVVTRSGAQAGAIADTTDTAVNIAAALPAGFTDPVSWEALVINTTTVQDTVSGGVGVTLSGKPFVLAPNTMARILVTQVSAVATTVYVESIEDIGIDNFTATTDPVVGNDNTQGYGAGSQWINTTNNREWTCVSAAPGAAVWSFSGAVLGSAEPSGIVTQFGAGTANFPEEGNVNRQISAAGVQPGGTAVDSVLAVYSLPANSFDQLGRGLQITAAGSFGATGNNKRIKIIFNATTAVVGAAVTGGTTVADSGVVTTNGGGWELSANVFKYGANGSNTQIGIHSQAQVGAAVSALLAPSLTTAVENGAILIAITGNATTAVSDIVFNWLEINAMN